MRATENAGGAALTATGDTDFTSAYELRDELVKDTFAGAPPPSANGEATNAHQDRGYDEYTREALLRLARDGIRDLPRPARPRPRDRRADGAPASRR